jgi:hypothetical protein
MYTRLISLFCLIVFQAFAAGPFGSEYGMTKEQIIAAVGQSAVEHHADEPGDILTLTTAPKPHPDFIEYMVMVSPTQGLMKILAFSETIKTSQYGEGIKNKFGEIQKLLTKTYGSSDNTFDVLRAGSIWEEPQHWMMGLLKKERSLETVWHPKSTNHIVLLFLEAKASSTETGYLHQIREDIVYLSGSGGLRPWTSANREPAGPGGRERVSRRMEPMARRRITMLRWLYEPRWRQSR